MPKSNYYLHIEESQLCLIGHIEADTFSFKKKELCIHMSVLHQPFLPTGLRNSKMPLFLHRSCRHAGQYILLEKHINQYRRQHNDDDARRQLLP